MLMRVAPRFLASRLNSLTEFSILASPANGYIQRAWSAQVLVRWYSTGSPLMPATPLSLLACAWKEQPDNKSDEINTKNQRIRNEFIMDRYLSSIRVYMKINPCRLLRRSSDFHCLHASLAASVPTPGGRSFYRDRRSGHEPDIDQLSGQGVGDLKALYF